MVNVTEPRLLANRYQVGDLIGRGGMAEVHAGWDVRLGRDVAIKILRSELARDSSFLLRFRREAQSAAGLNHPAIVAIFDSGEQTMIESGGAELSVPFIVMERVTGHTLREKLHELGRFEPAEAARVMAEMVRALGFSHDHGIVHRDVKPANVMVADSGDVKVMDFGIARAIADTAATMTNTAVVIGTAQYLSPEQAQGHDVDARSDLYSAGCLLYELLTGRTPFVGDSPVAVAYQHVGEPPAPPSQHAPGIPEDLDAITLKALAKDPDQRYQHAEAFADDLQAFVEGRAISDEAKAALPVGSATTAETSRAGDDKPALLEDLDGRRPPAADPETGTMPTITVAGGRRRRWILVAGIAALVVMVVVGSLLARGLIGPSRGVDVPNVVGLTSVSAIETLSREGLTTVLQPEPNSEDEGVVFRQDPAEGATSPPGSRVTLWVSTGPRTITLPDLKNFDQTSARQRLTDLGLVVGSIKQVDSYEVGVGNVVATEPKVGSQVEEGTSVDLLLSNGRVKVPNVVGSSEQQARATLNRLGLQARPSYVESGRAVGSVVSQTYAEEKVSVGTTIELRISRGRPNPPPTRTVTMTITPTAQTTPPPEPTEQPTSPTPEEP